MQKSTSSLQDEGAEQRGQDDKIYIIDTFPYNGELVTELRLKYLYGVVDEIMVVESKMTFSGKRKEFLYTDRDRRVFDPYKDKVCCSSILLQARNANPACSYCSACMLTQSWQQHTEILA